MDTIIMSNNANFHAVDSVRIEQLQQRVENLSSLVDTSSGIISNEIATSNNYLTIISVTIGILSLILTIIGLGIGYYINSLYKKVKAAEKTITEKEQTIKSLSNEVQEINDKISNDIESIYKKLRKEELKANINRLLVEPLDIKHHISSLLSNDLGDDMFNNLYDAYKKLIASGKADQGASLVGSTYRNDYLLVFFQHFLFQSLLNAGLREDMMKYLNTGCQCAFERDIIKCTKDLCKALNEPLLSKPADIIYGYLVAVNQSEFKNLNDIKDIITTELSDKSILRQAIDRCTTDGVYLELFDNKQPIDDER